MSSQVLRVWYKNWRGYGSHRKIRPKKVWYGRTKWHPEKQWFLSAYDFHRKEYRDFALQDMSMDEQHIRMNSGDIPCCIGV